ncbi:MAG: hypothetical protein QGI08_15135 [Paracoccaceae bacterium]|jgi:hypothetical protein|nr:hypothetical protein [Paracoccaceae bacterium]MDP7187050.1 hypothetical protein [Paracoccaceae bacterium]
MQITHKRSGIADKVPQTTDLALGELAINTHDGKLFLKKDDGVETVVEIGGTGGASEMFRENEQTLTTDHTLTADRNAISAGPVTINDNATLVIPTSSNWSVI